MSWESFSRGLLSIPLPLQWALAVTGTGIGLGFILAADRVIRGLRKWLSWQQRLVRRPGYRRMLRLYGWLLFGTGIALMLLLAVMRGR